MRKMSRNAPRSINNIALELIVDLRLSGQERGPVRGIQCAAFDVDRNGCSVLNVADVAVKINIRPVFSDFAVEGLEIGDGLILVFQVLSIRVDLFRFLPLVRLQFDYLLGPKVGENAVVTDDLLDLVEAPLQLTYFTNSNVVLGCTTSLFVLDGGVLTKDVAIADSVNLVAWVTARLRSSGEA